MVTADDSVFTEFQLPSLTNLGLFDGSIVEDSPRVLGCCPALQTLQVWSAGVTISEASLQHGGLSGLHIAVIDRA